MELLNDLISVLEDETVLYQDFLHILKKERDSIASFSVDDLNEIARKKIELIDAIRRAEGNRVAIVGSMGYSLDVKNLEFTISYLIKILDAPHATKLKNCANKLSSMVMEVSEFNKDNGVLIERSLRYISDSIRILSDCTLEKPTYSPSSSNYTPSDSGYGRVLSVEV